jgi:hypothetical protein
MFGLRSFRKPLLLAALATCPAHATPPAPPLVIDLGLEPAALRWTVSAQLDVVIVEVAWRTLPERPLATPDLRGSALRDGESRSGRIGIPTSLEWAELRLRVRCLAGEQEISATARARHAEPQRLPVVAAKSTVANGEVHARFVYEDRLLDEHGYSGQVQLLPLRQVDAQLRAEGTGELLGRGRLDDAGELRLVAPAGFTGVAAIHLASSIRTHPTIRLAVLEPLGTGPDALTRAQPHALVTNGFELGPQGADLGTIVLRDPDGRGRLQAFHILDVALDAWEALAASDFLGATPPLADSLLLLWGPDLRLRSTGYSGGLIVVTSPGNGSDTDGWSDGILIHEIGHHVARRFLRDTSVGGIHILGDVEQELQLAWSEGLATAFSCWARARRAAVRRNLAGESMDPNPALFVNAALPPPDGVAGGLQYVWDVEANTLGGMPLVRDGIGSETNVAAVLWDASDDATTPGAAPGDDDPAGLTIAGVFGTLRAMRGLAAPVTFETFWHVWGEHTSDPGGMLNALLAASHIEYAPDVAEPDALAPPRLAPATSVEAPGGVVISEIFVGTRIAVEIANRAATPVNIGGFALVARSNSSTTNPGLTYTLPPHFVLGPGARVVVRRSGESRQNGPRDLFPNLWTVPWFPRFDGALSLFDASGRGIDFVRWNAEDGTVSSTPPPPGVGWSGELPAPDFGRSLSRRAAVPDRDVADDFHYTESTLGFPNDTPGTHRTFFPAGDVDRVLLRADTDGIYSLATRRLRSGASPRVELFVPGATRPLALAPAVPGANETRITIRLQAGEDLEARLTQPSLEATRLGSYDLVFGREPDSRVPLPPIGLKTEVQLAGNDGSVHLFWRAAAEYDSVQVRADAGTWVKLPGTARDWETTLPIGRHRLDLVAFAGGAAAPSPPLVVAVEDWPATLEEGFETLSPEDWDRSGPWAVGPAPGRTGNALAAPPDGAYKDNQRGEARLRSAVRLAPGSALRFAQICIVRPEDTARIDLSDDWGATWQPLARYDFNVPQGRRDPVDWRDGQADATDWVEESIDLSAWSGQPVQVRFVFESDIHGTAQGWFIDDLRLGPAAPPVPVALRLDPAFPNPFNPTTNLRFALPVAGHVELRVFDVRGRLVRVVADAPYEAGIYTEVWNGLDGHGIQVPSGLYFAELRAPDGRRTVKLTVLR